MQKRLRSLFVALAAAIVTTLLLVLVYVIKDYVIIHFHYRSWSNLVWATRGFACASYIFLVVRIVSVVAHRIQYAQQQRAQAQREEERMKERKLKTPEEIKEFLLSEIEYSGIKNRLVEQLSEMDEYQARLNRLFEINDMEAFSHIVPMFQQVEDEICDNCRAAINHYIAGGKEEFSESAKNVIKQNDLSLGRVKTVLSALADYISGQVSRDSVSEVLDEFVQALATVQNNED